LLGLWSIVRRGLAPEPNERWPDMEALLGALERVPKRARRIGWSLTGTLASACLAVVVAEPRANACEAVSHELAGVWDEPRRAELEQHLATLELSQASHVQDSTERVLACLDAWSSSWLTEREQACRDHEARLGERAAILSREDCLDRQREQVQLLVDALDQADGATLAQGVVVLDEFPDPSACADSTFSPLEAPPLAQSLRIKQVRSELDHATRLRRLGQLGRALELARVVDAVAQTLDYGPLQAETRAELAKAEDVAGAPERSAVLYDEAIDLAEIHHHDRLSAQLWIERAELSLFDLRDPKQGEQWLHRAEVAQARVGRPDVQTQAKFAFGRARVAELSHQPEVAKAGYGEALRLAREIESGDVPTYLNNLARLVDSRDELLALRREAVEFAEAHWGARHPRTAEPLFNLGLALDDAGLGGEQELATAAAIWIEVHGHPHPMLGNAYLVLARAALRRGDLELAEHHARTLAAIQAKVLPARDPHRGYPDELLALVEGIRGHHESALAHALAARAWFEFASPGDPGALRMGREAANQLLALGRLDDATRELDHVLQQLGDDPAEEQQTRVLLAELTYEVLRTLIDHRRGRLDPAQLERLHNARKRSPFTDQQLVAWFDELELPRDERRLLE
jgi:tetratricopeptide (TPR) repeat protein